MALRRIYETIGGNGGGVVKVGRNDPCPCGSGRKYKNCCEGKTAAKDALYSKGLPILLGAVLVSVVVLIGAAFYSSAPTDARAGRVWSAEHGHWHDASGQQVP